MNPHTLNLEIILKEELSLYNKLYNMEQAKTDAIISRNGKLIEELSLDQDFILGRVAEIEVDRENLLKNFIKLNRMDDAYNEVTLKDVAARTDGNSAQKLIKTGNLLKQVLQKIKMTMETNQKLLDDNIGLFNSLLSGVKKSMSVKTGYGENGREEAKIESSLVFNRKI